MKTAAQANKEPLFRKEGDDMIRYGRLWVLMCALVPIVAGAQDATPVANPFSDAQVYFIPFSHLDFFWGGTREECLARGNQIIAKAIQLANQSSKFRFLLEDDVFVANFVDSHPGSQEVADLKRLVSEGRIEIAPKWVGIFQGLPDGEVHARNMAIGKRYAQDVFRVDPQVAHLGDLPGYALQLPQILQQSRVPYAVMTRMGPTDKSLFSWKAPDGSKTLVWNALKGYGWGTFLTSQTASDEQKQERLRKDVADLRANYGGPIFMNWGSDLFTPADDLVAQVEKSTGRAPRGWSSPRPPISSAKPARSPACRRLPARSPTRGRTLSPPWRTCGRRSSPPRPPCWRRSGSRPSTMRSAMPRIRSASSISCGKS
jgi:hypothetical protein